MEKRDMTPPESSGFLSDTAWLARRLRPCWPAYTSTAAGLFASQVARVWLHNIGAALSFRAAGRLGVTMRLKLLKRLDRLPQNYHDRTSAGEKQYLLDRDIEEIVQTGTRVAFQALSLVLTTVLAAAAITAMSWPLALFIVSLNVPLIVLRRGFARRMSESSERARIHAGRSAVLLQEHLPAIPQVQLFGRELFQEKRLLASWVSRLRAETSRQAAELRFRSQSAGVMSLGASGALGAAALAGSGALSAGQFVAIWAYVGQLLGPLAGTSELLAQAARVRTSAARVREVLANELPQEGLYIIDLPRRSGAPVELRDVHFAYPGAEPVLRGLTVRIPPGQTVAVVGPSGSGKTTIAKLIARMYDADRGVILVGGVDVRSATLRSLRREVTLVTHEGLLFQGSIRENLLFGAPEASETDL